MVNFIPQVAVRWYEYDMDSVGIKSLVTEYHMVASHSLMLSSLLPLQLYISVTATYEAIQVAA